MPEECRAAKHLRRNLKKLFKTNLAGKKLITFAHSPDPNKNLWIRKRIEALIAPTKIRPVASIGYTGNPQDNIYKTLGTAITEQTIR
jgi:hypothetical protein